MIKNIFFFWQSLTHFVGNCEFQASLPLDSPLLDYPLQNATNKTESQAFMKLMELISYTKLLWKISIANVDTLLYYELWVFNGRVENALIVVGW